MSIRSAILRITKFSDSRYEFSFELPDDQPWLHAVAHTCPVTVSPQVVQALCKRLGVCVDDANENPHIPNIAHGPFKVPARGLFEAFLSDREAAYLRDAIRKLRSPLLISTNDPYIHWEMFYDDAHEEFLGMRLDLGRQLAMGVVPRFSRPREGRWRCLIVADPAAESREWELPGAGVEAAKLRETLSQRDIDIDFLAGADATLGNVLFKLLESNYDIIHYAGHIVFDPSVQRYAWRLCGGELLHSGEMRKHVRGQPIVFLNGCNAASGEGMADAFLAAGAKAVIASLFEVPDEGGRAFAEKFYHLILEGRALGEAMRLARLHVREKSQQAPECGAAWACFVLYGDPSLKIEVPVQQGDRLEQLLQTLHLTRDRFDPGAMNVVELAFEYGRNVNGVSSVHLFAALIKGGSGFVKERLDGRGLAGEALHAAFHKAFAANEEPHAQDAPPQVSATTRKSLLLAGELAQAAGRERIAEIDLVRGFVGSGGGGAARILESLKLKIDCLNPDETARTPLRPRKETAERTPRLETIGPIHRDACAEDAIGILERATELALRGDGLLSTPVLFTAMAENERGALVRALRRIGLPPLNAARKGGEGGVKKTGSNLVCSRTTEAILLEALAQANVDGQRAVGEQDLLRAFVKAGGGSVRKAFEAETKLLLEALTARVFQEDGRLNSDVLDRTARAVLGHVSALLRFKNQQVVTTLHLLYGLLADDSSVLSERLRRLQRDPEHMANEIFAAMNGGAEPTVEEMSSERMTWRTVNALVRAEAAARQSESAGLTDFHILAGLLVDPGSAGNFLLARGVPMRKLVE